MKVQNGSGDERQKLPGTCTSPGVEHWQNIDIQLCCLKVKTTETKLARTKKGSTINLRLQFYNRITSMYAELRISRSSGHFSQSLRNSRAGGRDKLGGWH